METQLYKYWVEIEGKMKGKRKVTKESLHVALAMIEGKSSLEDITDVSHYVAELTDEHKPQKGAVWRFMRTIVTECTYDDGTTMQWVALFDVNRTVLASGDVKNKK